jgi:hypothetical protein
MKRTTLVLNSGLYAALRRRALHEGRTLTDVVERSLRAGMNAVSAAGGEAITLPSFDLGPYLVEPSADSLDRLGHEPTSRGPSRKAAGSRSPETER